MKKTAEPQTETILICMIADSATSTVPLLERVPEHMLNHSDVHLLVFQDAGNLAEMESLRKWAADTKFRNLRVLKSRDRQGFGGIQKLCFRYAIDLDFKLAVIMHVEDGHDPVHLGLFIDAWKENKAEVILGTRITDSKNTTAGRGQLRGKPSSRFLNWYQNHVTGLCLRDWTSEYRAYSTDFLRSVPFEINSNGCAFSSELLFQAHNMGVQAYELEIQTAPALFAAQKSRLRDVWNIYKSSFQYKMHCRGMMCSLKYRNLNPLNYGDKTDILYSSHRLAINLAADCSPKRILDIGCGPGFVAKKCETTGAEVTGLDIQEPLPEMMHAFHKCDLERESLPVDAFAYDVILMLDILEHLSEPERLLLNLRNQSQSLRPGQKEPKVLISTCNIGFIVIILNLILGRFNYATRGILDITHKRFFTYSSFARMLRDCGYKVEKIKPLGVPFEVVLGGRTGRFLGAVCQGLAVIWPRLFAFQFMAECRPEPGVKQILQDCRH